jgi:hypothetical protein
MENFLSTIFYCFRRKRAMKQFIPLLKDINSRLDLPQPLKSRILLEIAGDLDDLYLIYRKRGMAEEEACRLSEEKFSLTDEAISELVGIHQSFYRKMLNRLTCRAQTLWERLFVGLLTIILVYSGGAAMLSTHFFSNTSSYTWPVMVIAVIALSITLFKWYSLFIKKDHRIQSLRRGLPAILLLGGISLTIGTIGYFSELYLAEGYGIFLETKLFFLFHAAEDIPHEENALRFVTNWMIQTYSMVMASMLVGISCGLIWFFLNRKVSGIEQAEASFLLEQ